MQERTDFHLFKLRQNFSSKIEREVAETANAEHIITKL